MLDTELKYDDFIAAILNNRGRHISDDLYYETHHIVPKSCGGSNDENNLIDLYPREHFIAHKLLMLENPDSIPLRQAFACMSHMKTTTYQISADEYAEIKRMRRPLSAETVEKIRKARKGKAIWTDEQKDAISERMKGNKHALGHKLSEETKAKIKETKKINGTDKWSENHWATYKEHGPYHWNLSEETKQKISASRKGMRFSEEHKAHISAAQKGKPKPGSKYIHTKEQAAKAWNTRRANGTDSAHNLGKIAINNGMKTCYISKDIEIPSGWQLGSISPKTNSHAGKKWVNNGQYAILIPVESLNEYLDSGYTLGKNKLQPLHTDLDIE